MVYLKITMWLNNLINNYIVNDNYMIAHSNFNGATFNFLCFCKIALSSGMFRNVFWI